MHRGSSQKPSARELKNSGSDRSAFPTPICACMELEHRHGGWMLRSMISPDMLDASLA